MKAWAKLTIVGVLVLGSVSLSFLLVSNSGDVLEHYEDGKLKFNYSSDGEGWVLKVHVWEVSHYAKARNLSLLMGQNKLNGNGQGEIITYDYFRNMTVEHRGTFKDGRLREGEIIGYDGYGNKWYEYEGTFKDGKLHGEGEYVSYGFFSGNREGNKEEEQRGTFKDGKLHGEGVIIEHKHHHLGKNKIERKGTFKDGALNGEGRLIVYDKNGNKAREYVGTFKPYKLIEGDVYDYRMRTTRKGLNLSPTLLDINLNMGLPT